MKYVRYLCCALMIVFKPCFSQDEEPTEVTTDTYAETPPEVHLGAGAAESGDACKSNNGRNIIITVALFGVAAVALAFVSHNAD